MVGCDDPGGFLTKFSFLMLVITAGIEAGAYLTLDATYSNCIALYIYIYIYIYIYTHTHNMDTRLYHFEKKFTLEWCVFLVVWLLAPLY